MFWRREKSLVPTRDQIPDHPAHSIVAVQTKVLSLAPSLNKATKMGGLNYENACWNLIQIFCFHLQERLK
jgi:hypothetical protein